MSPNQIIYGFWGLLRISFVRSIQPWKQTKTGTEVPSLMFLRWILQPHPHRPLRMRRGGNSNGLRLFPPTPSPPVCHPARRARAGGVPPSSVRHRRPPASAARMGAWGRRGGAFGVAALGGQADRALDRLGGATQRQPDARGAGGRGDGWQPGAAKLRPAPRQRASR
jgi:hypothetical protein